MNKKVKKKNPNLVRLEKKLEKLHRLSEEQLIKKVIKPLFKDMGYNLIQETHGICEHGLDLIFCKKIELLEIEYTGVQAKAKKIHGSAGKKGNAAEILNQAVQAFSHSFMDIRNGKTKSIDKYLVINSKEMIF